METIFGDSIAAIDDCETHAKVGFEHAASRDVDLVVGADGLHSKVRQISFGTDRQFEFPMGCHVASFEVAGYRPREDRLYVAHTAPGRYIARFPVPDDKTLIFVLLRDEYLADGIPASESARKQALTRAFSDMGWECPAIMSALQGVDGIYFDSISQIRMDSWTKGRVVLLGDAAACPSLIAGEGAGFALAEAYVLAGETHKHGPDLKSALTAYQSHLKPYATRKQRYAESGALVCAKDCTGCKSPGPRDAHDAAACVSAASNGPLLPRRDEAARVRDAASGNAWTTAQ